MIPTVPWCPLVSVTDQARWPPSLIRRLESPTRPLPEFCLQKINKQTHLRYINNLIRPENWGVIQPKILGWQPLSVKKKPPCSINRLKYSPLNYPTIRRKLTSWKVSPSPKRPFKNDCKVQLITRLSVQLSRTSQLTFVLFLATRNHTTLT